MERLPVDVVKSFHYSRVRIRTFGLLGEHGPLYPSDLARRAKIDAKTLKWVMFGHERKYHEERSLVPLGLVQRVEDKNGAYFDLTSFGRRVFEFVKLHGFPRR